MENGEQLTFEFEQRPTIKGFPELRWTGKRPYRSTQYYPAQLRETYGKEQNGWINKIFWGDNLQVMSHLLKEYRGQIDLIYIDPPFDSKADYKKKIEIKGVGKAVSDSSSFEEKQYGDIWTNDEYLQFMYERILLLRELLSDTGSIFLHCDDSRNFYLRCLLSEVFGEDNFHNEIIWKRSTATGLASKRCGTLHDTIYWYSKTDQYYFEMYSMSTRAFSAMDTARASLAVSTVVTASWGLMVRWVNISALRSSLPSSSTISKAQSR